MQDMIQNVSVADVAYEATKSAIEDTIKDLVASKRDEIIEYTKELFEVDNINEIIKDIVEYDDVLRDSISEIVHGKVIEIVADYFKTH